MIFNGAQIHLLVNHLPVVGFVGVVIALSVAMYLRSIDIKRFVLLATAVVGLSALAPYLTGEDAEETIEDLPEISKELIHEHEELAEMATILSVITGIGAAIAFFLQRRRPEMLQRSLLVILMLSILSAGFMGATAHEGGKIRHSEIRSQ